MNQSLDRMPGSRIVVVGVTGCGKTTTAARLSALFNLRHIELDALHWLPNWVTLDLEPFRQAVTQAVSGPAWVLDGNYSKVRDLIWVRADTLVWLDYPLPVILWQLTRRTLRRMITREVLWNTNRETFRDAFFSKDSLFRWAFTSYDKHRKTYPALLADPENAHLRVIHLRSRAETASWLTEIEAQVAQKCH